jgi:hypothetical protein
MIRAERVKADGTTAPKCPFSPSAARSHAPCGAAERRVHSEVEHGGIAGSAGASYTISRSDDP